MNKFVLIGLVLSGAMAVALCAPSTHTNGVEHQEKHERNAIRTEDGSHGKPKRKTHHGNAAGQAEAEDVVDDVVEGKTIDKAEVENDATSDEDSAPKINEEADGKNI